MFGRTPTRSGNQQLAVYECPNRARRRLDDPQRCDDTPVRVDVLDRMVWDQIIATLTTPTTASDNHEHLWSLDADSLAAAANTVDDLRREIVDRYQAALDAGATAAEGRAHVVEQGRALSKILAQLEHAKQAVLSTIDPDDLTAILQATKNEPIGSLEQRQRVLHALNATVAIRVYQSCEGCLRGGQYPSSQTRPGRIQSCPDCRGQRRLPQTDLEVTNTTLVTYVVDFQHM